MYCSLRMYVNIASDLISTQNILTLFELFSSTFGWSNDYIRYTLFDPDRDELLIDEKFSYDATGKNAFLNANVVPLATGQHGDLSAPLITATSVEEANQLLIVIYCFTGRPGLFNTIRTFVWICTVISLGPLVLGIRFYSVVGGFITMAFIAELFLLYSTLKNQSTDSCE